MKIFSIVGLALAANSMLASGNILRQQQLVIGQAVKPIVPDHYLPPPEAPVPEPIVEGAVNLDGTLAAPVQGSPYSFAYEHSGEQLSSSRSESSDGKKVTGHYTLQGADGIQRIVHYVADFDGFRASIQTNEPGTESHNPSGVVYHSNQLPAAELSRQYVPVVPVETYAQPSQPAVAQPAFVASAQPFIVPANNAQSFALQPNYVAFAGQQQQQEEDEEPAIEQQQQQQQEEEQAPAKTRPLPTLAPSTTTTTTTPAPIVASIKGRPIRITPQQPTKNVLPQPRPIQAPIKAPAPLPTRAPVFVSIKGKPAPPVASVAIPAPAKGKVVIQPAPVAAPIKAKPAPVLAPAPILAPAPAPIKGRPPVKSQAPNKNGPAKRPQQPSFVPRPIQAILPAAVPAKVIPSTARLLEIPQQPQYQQQQQQEEEEPLPQQQIQTQQLDQVFDEGHEEGLVEQEF